MVTSLGPVSSAILPVLNGPTYGDPLSPTRIVSLPGCFKDSVRAAWRSPDASIAAAGQLGALTQIVSALAADGAASATAPATAASASFAFVFTGTPGGLGGSSDSPDGPPAPECGLPPDRRRRTDRQPVGPNRS